jgi:putative DNA primase/helicase
VQAANKVETSDVNAAGIVTHGIRIGSWKSPVDEIREIYWRELAAHGDREKAKDAVKSKKEQLPGILFSGRFSQRKKEYLIQHSGLLCADLDSLGERRSSVREKLIASPFLFALFLSPSGDGLKPVFRISTDAEKHLASFRAVERHVLELTGIQIDPSGKDPTRIAFVSYDPDAYYNPGAIELELLPEPEKPDAAKSRSPGRDSKPTKAQIREMLGVIPNRPDYHDWITVVAAVGDALPDDDAIEVLNEWSSEEEPGEYAKKLHSGFEKIHIGTLIHLARQYGWTEKIVAPRAKVEASTAAWQDPQALPEDLPAVPPFDYQCLSETLRPHIKDIAERMQCPPDFPAVGMMIALGSVLGRKIGIRPKRRDDWLEIANLWGCIIGRPGLLKTPALQQALVHLRRLAAKAYEKFKEEMREYAINMMLAAQSKKIVEDKIKQHLKDHQALEARKAAEDHLDKAHQKPICRRYEVNDSTIEKLGELLAENPNGLLLDRDELSGFLRDLDREERAGDRAKFLEMWDGKGEFTYDRIGRGTVRVPSNTGSILGGIQPDVVTSYVREAVRGGTGNDGLLQRIQLFVWPDVIGDFRNVDEWPDTEAKNQAFAVFEYLDNLTPEEVGADTSEGIPFLRFSDDAQECFDAWRTKLEKKLRSDVEHPAFEAHLAKYRKLVPALALLIHLAERKKGRVSLSALSQALLWADYLEAHARRIYSAVLRPDTAAARELAKHLQRGDLPERFRLREVYRKGWTGLSNKEDAEAATEILCDLGWIRLAAPAPDRAPGTPGRAASQMFEVNPKILRPPSIPADKTDTINSGGSVSGYPGVPQDFEEPNPEPVSANPKNLKHLSPPTDKTDTIGRL